MSFQYKPIYQFPDYAQQEHSYSNGINNMHYFKVETGRPVRILFSEEVHNKKLFVEKIWMSSYEIWIILLVMHLVSCKHLAS